jgi:hypothetical protein
MANRYLPSGFGPPIIRVGEHMSKKRGRSVSASTVSSEHRPDAYQERYRVPDEPLK